MIPFLTRLPTAAEVRAHAIAHPAQYPYGRNWGVWSAFDGVPAYVLLSAVWLPDGDMLTERRYPGAKWLPCTAEGVPVLLADILAKDARDRECIAGIERAIRSTR